MKFSISYDSTEYVFYKFFLVVRTPRIEVDS